MEGNSVKEKQLVESWRETAKTMWLIYASLSENGAAEYGTTVLVASQVYRACADALEAAIAPEPETKEALC